MRYKSYLISFLIISLAFIWSSEGTAKNDQVIPLDPAAWQNLEFSDIKANVLSWQDQTLKILVDDSASPLIYPLPTPTVVSALEVVAKITGSVFLPAGAAQDTPEVDDFRLRVGLVYAGSTRMGFMQSLVAPDWLKTLFELAPENSGISRVEFYSTWLDSRLRGSKRVLDDRGLMHQHFVLVVSENGVVDQRINVPTDQSVVAVWISSDGDGTGSVFEVSIEELRLISEAG